MPLPPKIVEQVRSAGLPLDGAFPFVPALAQNRKRQPIVEKRAVGEGPKKGKKGYVDDQGRIWIRDRAHSGLPDHWDVQIDDGAEYVRIDDHGSLLS